MNHRIAIIGAGLIGKKRAQALRSFNNCKLVLVVDVDLHKAKKLAREFGADEETDWKKAVKRPDIDIVIVSTVNNALAPICKVALENGKHILCEKPFGKTPAESKIIIATAKKHKRLVKVGFNHRFHPAIMKAKKLHEEGIIGKILFIRARYGHGGRVGMEKEWRMNKKISGGGELLDQGVHLVDLCRWFGGEFTAVSGKCETKFWKTEVEDNAFVTMNNKGVTAFFHVSTNNWGNIFSFEIFGDKGALVIDGLGGNYGMETLNMGVTIPPYGNLKSRIFRYKTIDLSWKEEWKNFMRAIEHKSKLVGSGDDGLRANELIAAIYKSSKLKRVINLT